MDPKPFITIPPPASHWQKCEDVLHTPRDSPYMYAASLAAIVASSLALATIRPPFVLMRTKGGVYREQLQWEVVGAIALATGMLVLALPPTWKYYLKNSVSVR